MAQKLQGYTHKNTVNLPTHHVKHWAKQKYVKVKKQMMDQTVKKKGHWTTYHT